MWWISFVVLCLVGGVWALASPLMSVPDEPAHAIKAAAMWRGELRGYVIDLPPGNPAGVPSQVVDKVPEEYAQLHDEPSCYKGKPSQPAGCTPVIDDDQAIVQIGSPAGTYPPLFYAAVGWTSRLLSPYRAIYGMRLCSVLMCAALLASALASARSLGRTRLAVGGVVLAVTPMTLFLAGSVNPNGLEIAASIATFVVLLDLLTRRGAPPTRLLVRALVVASCFVAARPLSPLYFVLAIGFVVVAALTRERLSELVADTRARIAGAALAVVALLSALLMVLAPPPLAGLPRPDLTFRNAFPDSFDLLDFRARQMIGLFGWLDTVVPDWLTHGWLWAVGCIVVVALVVDTTVRRRITLLGAVAATVLVPLTIESVQAHEIGLYWQGRYTLPLAVGVPILAGWMIADAPLVATAVGRRIGTAVVVVISVGVGFVQLFAWATALSRYVVGAPTGTFSFLHGDGWRPPFGSSALFGLALVAFVAYAGWMILLAVGGPPSADAARASGRTHALVGAEEGGHQPD